MSPPQRKSRPAGTGRPGSESLAGGLDSLDTTAKCPPCGGPCRAAAAIATLGGRDVLTAAARRRRVNAALRPRYDQRRRSLPFDTGAGAWPWLGNTDPRHRPGDHLAYLLHADALSIDNRLAAAGLFAERWGEPALVQALRAAHRLAPLHPRLTLLLRRLTLAGQP